MSVPVLLRVAAILHWIIAVGFGVFYLPAIRNLLSGRDIPMVMGFPAYGRGPFERIGIPTTVPLLAAFLLVCILEAVAGFLLWRGSLSGAVFALVLLPLGGVFWWGFALPIPPIFALVWIMLILLGANHGSLLHNRDDAQATIAAGVI
jgi:hypothetical protein